MMFKCLSALCMCAALSALAVPASAQSLSPDQSAAAPSAPADTARQLDVPTAPLFSSLFTDTVSDFKRLPSRSNLLWLGLGGAAVYAGHFGDANASQEFSELRRFDTAFKQGTVVGSAPAQMGASLITYALGRSMGSARTAQVGADLFRAQAIAQTLSYGLKWTARRTRPDGTSFSFPSGHAAVAFASATVLQRDLGWKVGAPAYAVAGYVAASRVQRQRHYLSDVAFGAVLGMVAARTVRFGHGDHRFAVGPMAAPGGGGVAFTWVGQR
jgi:membrane-associated phospholipid phosphatase